MVCAVCQRSGILVQCTSCNRHYHEMCVNTPVGKKFKCPTCHPHLPKYTDNKFFRDLMQNYVYKAFELPNYITCIPKMEHWAIMEENEALMNKEPEEEEEVGPDPYVLCFQCQSGYMMGPMVQCVMCEDWYHYDCVSPPIIIDAPKLWLCPKHVHHLINEKYYAEVPRGNSNIQVIEQSPQLNAFGVLVPKLMPAEAIQQQFIAKCRPYQGVLTNQDMARMYLETIEDFCQRAVTTVQQRFCLDEPSCEKAFKKLEELHAVIQVL